jgi:Zn finger protein HypA/HybF involved in hydrogenase expression
MKERKYKLEFTLREDEVIKKDNTGWYVFRYKIYCKDCGERINSREGEKLNDKFAIKCPNCKRILPMINEELCVERGIGLDEIINNGKGTKMLGIKDLLELLNIKL